MPRRSNCLFFAVAAWWRWRKRGAYLSLRLSRHIAGWHYLVNHRGRWIHYEPVDPQPLPQALWHKLWYIGRVRRSDEPQ